ncbi:phosphatidylglycerophosphatase A [Thalassotalea sp. 1_MG-2023]|uniref:phosphatidylglycerophosphatase A family protein n=1 Tax=Thalassotalea sp. 1_MG-2023 TaxID=3062680 RepID=UPI0026E362F7|nr:phosphatidylglycerophosphatase A [Thalassotalea sp. 1_MG-2023]MDO6426520.1 phosphatidylglycerophosphatase A [Thalassotalea sp. 1_MG-2023]
MNNKPKEIKSKFSLSDPVQFLALGFGSGLIPKAPGTFGTLAAIPVFLLLAPLPTMTYLAVVAVMALFGIYICSHAAKAAKVHDHPAIVWDEIVGYLITMALIPVSWKSIIVGFLLFRLFDIIKPWPISLLDKHCHGGFGIMIDDIAAGLVAFLCMYFLF